MENDSRSLAVGAGARGLPPAIPQARLFLAQHEWDALSDKLADPFFAKVAEHCRRFVREFPAKTRSSLVDVPKSLDATEGRNECYKVHSVMPMLLSFDDDEPIWEHAGDRATLTLCGHRWHIDLAEGTLSIDEGRV